MIIILIVMIFITVYLVIMTSIGLSILMEISDTLTIIKNQTREMVAHDILKRLQSKVKQQDHKSEENK